MRLAGYLLSCLLLALGALLLVSAAELAPAPQAVAGAGILGAGLAALCFLRSREPAGPRVAPDPRRCGGVRLEGLGCRHCGAGLGARNASLEAGAVFVSCPHCGAHYPIDKVGPRA